ncbi:MAG: DNA-directed RNA polymerase subunit omega [Candidatus Tectimicrobiota bacterium]
MATQHALLDAAIRKVGNRYLTTMLIAKRIRQLHHGSPPLVDYDEDESYFTVAVREIAEGHLTIEPNDTEIYPLIPTPPPQHASNGSITAPASLPEANGQQ